MAQALGWPPRFLSPLRRPEEYLRSLGHLPALSIVTAALLLVVLAVIGADSRRRRDRTVGGGRGAGAGAGRLVDRRGGQVIATDEVRGRAVALVLRADGGRPSC
jgi:hypothetical protein